MDKTKNLDIEYIKSMLKTRTGVKAGTLPSGWPQPPYGIGPQYVLYGVTT